MGGGEEMVKFVTFDWGDCRQTPSDPIRLQKPHLFTHQIKQTSVRLYILSVAIDFLIMNAL